MSTYEQELHYPITGEEADWIIDKIRETDDDHAYLEIKYIITYHERKTARLIIRLAREIGVNLT